MGNGPANALAHISPVRLAVDTPGVATGIVAIIKKLPRAVDIAANLVEELTIAVLEAL